MGVIDNLKKHFNIFSQNKDPTTYWRVGGGDSRPSDLYTYRTINERTIINAIYTRISVDAAAVALRHVKVDEEEKYIDEYTDSYLHDILTREANIDQTGREFIQNVVMNMLDTGFAAIVPVHTLSNSADSATFDILDVRLGKIVEWFPRSIRVELYNEDTGLKEQIIRPKSTVAIIRNPFYSVLNDRNSVLQRLLRKLNQLDMIDNKIGTGKIDMVVQTPYPVKTEKRLNLQKVRRDDWKQQMEENENGYGIITIDGSEKITQLNRPLENNLQTEVEYLTNLLYSQTTMSQEILNNSANESQVYYYLQRTIEPIVSAITDEMNRKFLTKTAYRQGQRIEPFMEPLKLVPVGEIAKIADVFSRNGIMTPNELRQKVGLKPLDDGVSDQVGNRNMPYDEQMAPQEGMAQEQMQ